jgi:hypothetical protein
MNIKLLTLISILLLLISCNEYGEKIESNGTTVYYTEGATKEQAQKLLDYLIKSGFTNGKKKSVQLAKNSDTGNLIFKMVVGEEVYNTNNYDNVFSVFPAELSTAYDTVKVNVHLTDDTFKTQKIFLFKDSQQSIMALATEVRYTPAIKTEEAQLLANYLIKEEFADNKNPKTVLLDKQGKTYLFKMVVGDTNVSENTILLLKQFGVSLSNDVFNNNNVEMHACDENMKSIKIVKQ